MSADSIIKKSALDLTYVLYNGDSHKSHVLALLTLTPILLNPAYAALSVWTRELVFVEMWAGQMLCETFNWVLKHIIKQERPYADMGDGYGFPSSHSQWMGYFAAFLICHFTFRHRFIPTGFPILDKGRTLLVYIGIIASSTSVAYSRYHLTYHTASQVIWGFSIGLSFGFFYYLLIEFIPMHYPSSLLGWARHALLHNPISAWFRLRDSWAVYQDGGVEDSWLRWREEWERLQKSNGQAKQKKL